MKQSKTSHTDINVRYLGTDDLAKHLGKSPSFIRKLARDRIIPYVKIPGRDRLFDRFKVDEALSRFEIREVR